jgi:hypothetical protein
MAKNPKSKTETDQPVIYEIRIGCQLDSQWMSWFDDLAITVAESGETLIVGPVADQAALFGLLKKVRDLGLPLVSVNPVKPGPSIPFALRGLRGIDPADQPDVKS